MVAIVPFDWQAHDTYFVVAHLHYVLIGGMVFPLFAALYYWVPYVSRNALSERIGRWVFGLMFVGFNVDFLSDAHHRASRACRGASTPTRPGSAGTALNLVSTDRRVHDRGRRRCFSCSTSRATSAWRREENAGNVWNAGTLEWLPNGNYSNRSIPIVTSREPLWDQPNLAKDVEAGRYYLPGAPTGGRETIVTSPIEARAAVPASDAVPVAGRTASPRCSRPRFFLLLTVKLVRCRRSSAA